MKEKTIKIAEVCGEDIVSRDDGLKFRNYIVQELSKFDILILDFEGLTIASVSFMDEAFAKLAFGYDREELATMLKFENMNEFDKDRLNELTLDRLNQKKTMAAK